MTDEQTAAAIVADSMNTVSETAMEAAIVRALQSARTPPPGHIIDDAGVVRKVLGTLPVTADGCVIGLKSLVTCVSDNGTIHPEGWAFLSPHFLRFPKVYSSRNAAESARKDATA